MVARDEYPSGLIRVGHLMQEKWWLERTRESVARRLKPWVRVPTDKTKCKRLPIKLHPLMARSWFLKVLAFQLPGRDPTSDLTTDHRLFLLVFPRQNKHFRNLLYDLTELCRRIDTLSKQEIGQMWCYKSWISNLQLCWTKKKDLTNNFPWV